MIASDNFEAWRGPCRQVRSPARVPVSLAVDSKGRIGSLSLNFFHASLSKDQRTDAPSYAGGSRPDAMACYPLAQATQEQIVADKELFLTSLKTLHEQLGTQFRVPQVCGRDLDLHLLYKQVSIPVSSKIKAFQP